jgi:hypothetical protein
MQGGGRHVYGPRSLAALLPALTRPAFRHHAPGAAQVLSDWPSIVGPALAALAMPRRVAAGTLTVACAGPVAIELQHLAPELMARINTYLGHDVVRRLRFEQAATVRRPPPAPSALSAAAAAPVAQAIAGLPAGPLRDALASLGRAIVARQTGSTATRSDA